MGGTPGTNVSLVYTSSPHLLFPVSQSTSAAAASNPSRLAGSACAPTRPDLGSALPQAVVGRTAEMRCGSKGVAEGVKSVCVWH